MKPTSDAHVAERAPQPGETLIAPARPVPERSTGDTVRITGDSPHKDMSMEIPPKKLRTQPCDSPQATATHPEMSAPACGASPAVQNTPVKEALQAAPAARGGTKDTHPIQGVVKNGATTSSAPVSLPTIATVQGVFSALRAGHKVNVGPAGANVPVAPNALPALQKYSMEKLSKAAEAKLERVPRESSEYVQVMMHIGNMDVDSVRKLRNEDVDMAFTIAVSGVPGKHEIIKVLHGTNVEAIDAIVREGFKVGGEEVKVRHGSANGKGVYLTTIVQMAARYSKRHKCKYMMLCELCVDARCIKVGDGVFVQPDKALVRPRYVVEFKQPPPPGTRRDKASADDENKNDGSSNSNNNSNNASNNNGNA